MPRWSRGQLAPSIRVSPQDQHCSSRRHLGRDTDICFMTWHTFISTVLTVSQAVHFAFYIFFACSCSVFFCYGQSLWGRVWRISLFTIHSGFRDTRVQVKPANVLITDNGTRVVLGDLGNLEWLGQLGASWWYKWSGCCYVLSYPCRYQKINVTMLCLLRLNQAVEGELMYRDHLPLRYIR